MIVQQGATVTVTLNNALPVPVSILFPGQKNVAASGGAPGLLTREAPPRERDLLVRRVRARTYLYYSGTQPELQIEMGLVGAIVVRPNAADPMRQAYTQPGTGSIANTCSS